MDLTQLVRSFPDPSVLVGATAACSDRQQPQVGQGAMGEPAGGRLAAAAAPAGGQLAAAAAPAGHLALEQEKAAKADEALLVGQTAVRARQAEDQAARGRMVSEPVSRRYYLPSARS